MATSKKKTPKNFRICMIWKVWLNYILKYVVKNRDNLKLTGWKMVRHICDRRIKRNWGEHTKV